MFKDKWCRPSGHSLPRIILWILAGIFFAAMAALIFGFIVMHLWNWLMPELFGFHTLTFLQAFGLVLLVKLLFGSGFHDHFEKHHRRRFPDREERKRFRNFWNDEGRAAFDAYVRKSRCGNDPAE
jgi:hypothetical protein